MTAERVKNAFSLEDSKGTQVGAREKEGGLALRTLLYRFLRVVFHYTDAIIVEHLLASLSMSFSP